MNQDQRRALLRATQQARALLEKDFLEQLEGTYGIRAAARIQDSPPPSLDIKGRMLRSELITGIRREHEGKTDAAKIQAWVREAAFTMLNRFVALKMMEARGLVQECVSRGEASAGFGEFLLLAPDLREVPDHAYRLYVESLFDEIGQEVRVLFDRMDPASLLWPRRTALLELLGLLNAPELSEAWVQDETIGWVYQYFNADEERKAIRDEARSGPRNSRELAILNQFFTPRFVVRFLVENTLGRMWWAMRQGATALAEECRLLAVRPGHEPESRPKKDPRDIRVLDPASGSGHFLLYAFDLLLTIYREAWADLTSPPSEATGHTLREAYPSREGLERALPGLILEYNLFGVDIDPRCAQIASLALWLRAQRAYQEGGLARQDRPPIRRTNLVVAEPMPADPELRHSFLTSLDPELREVVAEVFLRMELAGDAGTLLRIERDVEEIIRERLEGYGGLFAESEEERWASTERELYAALERYAESATNGSFARRLFAQDTARGFAFIEVCRRRYDVVLMNPPFGASSVGGKDYIARTWPRTKNDLYAAFVERGLDLLVPGGMLGAITSRTGLFLSSFRKWREEILLKQARPVVVADLGYGVLDAMVETAAYCLEVR